MKKNIHNTSLRAAHRYSPRPVPNTNYNITCIRVRVDTNKKPYPFFRRWLKYDLRLISPLHVSPVPSLRKELAPQNNHPIALPRRYEYHVINDMLTMYDIKHRCTYTGTFKI